MDTVFFVLSKLARAFIDPGNAILGLLVVGCLFLYARRQAFGRKTIVLTTVLAIAVTFSPVGDTALRILEDRFPAPQTLPQRIDGIIVLGGVLNPSLSVERDQLVVGDSVERLIEFTNLAARYPEAVTVFTGGTGRVFSQDLKEADFVEPILQKLGMDTREMIFENQSRNTYENAMLSKPIVNPAPDSNWILVTSAAHMPRSVGVFRKTNWPGLIPYPVDFKTQPSHAITPPFSLTRGLYGLANAATEYVGLLSYYVTGKTDDLFPAPN